MASYFFVISHSTHVGLYLYVDCLVFFQYVPCYTRACFLEKFGIPTSETKDFKVELSTEEGFKFNVRVTNAKEMTFSAGT